MKNKNMLKIGLYSGLSILFLIVGSIFAAGASKSILNDGVYLLNVAFAFLFFMFFIVSVSFAFFYVWGNVKKNKKYSNEVQIDEIEKIEPKIFE